LLEAELAPAMIILDLYYTNPSAEPLKERTIIGVFLNLETILKFTRWHLMS
jgi:hypothetical protein